MSGFVKPAVTNMIGFPTKASSRARIFLAENFLTEAVYLSRLNKNAQGLAKL